MSYLLLIHIVKFLVLWERHRVVPRGIAKALLNLSCQIFLLNVDALPLFLILHQLLIYFARLVTISTAKPTSPEKPTVLLSNSTHLLVKLVLIDPDN